MNSHDFVTRRKLAKHMAGKKLGAALPGSGGLRLTRGQIVSISEATSQLTITLDGGDQDDATQWIVADVIGWFAFSVGDPVEVLIAPPRTLVLGESNAAGLAGGGEPAGRMAQTTLWPVGGGAPGPITPIKGMVSSTGTSPDASCFLRGGVVFDQTNAALIVPNTGLYICHWSINYATVGAITPEQFIQADIGVWTPSSGPDVILRYAEMPLVESTQPSSSDLIELTAGEYVRLYGRYSWFPSTSPATVNTNPDPLRTYLTLEWWGD